MTKAEIVGSISEAIGLTKVDTEAVVNGFIYSIGDALKNGDGVEIRGFGTFKVREKNARIARNPRTGEKVMVPKKLVPFFKPSRELKQLINSVSK
ncbi:MAG: integration host factor subunit beta [Candidatus Helarchaeota archaeon]|nr:integration host factor subunit beta [Candidatus Helarchaeota archaeon]